ADVEEGAYPRKGARRPRSGRRNGMTPRRLDWARAVRGLAPVALAASIVLGGCGKQAAPPSGAAQPQTTTARPVPPADPGQPSPAPAEPTQQRPADPLHQPFGQAVRAGDDPPAECNRPPDRTLTGKPVFRILRQVQQQWDAIAFVSAGGKPLAYTAVVDTDEGVIEITLRPDLAPNHVRNFVALARSGYYDGLCFERSRHEEAEEEGAKVLDEIEAGCPLGTGEAGNGSIGYWLGRGFGPTEKPSHEGGPVGACRGYEADTAACRFYITLTPAPYLDGNYTIFGKVTRGLDTARKIF